MKKICLPFEMPVEKPPLRKKELEILSRKEQKKLEENLRKNRSNIELGILISLYTGLRVGEVCALQWGDIDLESGFLHVRKTVIRVEPDKNVKGSYLKISTPKTKSSVRTIPIPEDLFPVLKEMGRDDKVFVASGNERFTLPSRINRHFHRILRECGIRNVNYHALRHTFATRCLEDGVDVKTLSYFLGHADAKITLNTYVHTSAENMKVQMAKVKHA